MHRTDRLGRVGADLALAVVLTAVILGPLLISGGYWLGGDMVFVPRQPWKGAWLGLDGTFPRAVPVDAVTSALTHVLPGWLVQRLLLAGPMIAGGLGAGRLAARFGARWYARAAAIALFVWNPWVGERMLMGQWAILAGYFLLPWVAIATWAYVSGTRNAAAPLVALCVAGLLGPPPGIMAAGVAGVVALTAKRRWARLAAVVASAIVANLPWLVPAAFARGVVTTGASGFEAFGPRAESSLGVAASLLSLGGTWKTAIVPESRHSALVVGLSLALTAVAVVGSVGAARRSACTRPLVVALAVAGVAGLLIGLVAAVPAGSRWLGHVADSVGPVALIRDAQRWLAWFAVALVAGYAAAVTWVARKAMPGREALRGVVGLLVIAPVLLLPGLAWGAGGQLRTASFPADWDRVAKVLKDDPGRTVVLPWTGSYRGYAWNRRRAQLDPAPRYFAGEVLIDDRLLLGRTTIGSEDPELARVRVALTATEPGERRDGLHRLGVRWVLVEAGNGVRTADLPSGHTRYAGSDLTLIDLGRPARVPSTGLGRGERTVVVAADLATLAALAGAIFVLTGRKRVCSRAVLGRDRS